MVLTPRYDGLASWYDETFGWYATAADGPGAELSRLMGEGPGLVLDVGCGTGLSASGLERAGWTVGGIDESADQLRLAGDRCGWLVLGDACCLPFPAGSVPRAAVVLVHTDVDDYGRLLAEVARVVVPGGTIVHVGVHPCFVGHHVESVTRSDERLAVVAGYREGRWVQQHENFGPGVRGRVGARHLPLADLLNAFGDAGLCIKEVSEGGTHVVPWLLSIRAAKLE